MDSSLSYVKSVSSLSLIIKAYHRTESIESHCIDEHPIDELAVAQDNERVLRVLIAS